MNIKQLSILGIVGAVATSFIACSHHNDAQSSAQSAGSVGGKTFKPSAAFFTAQSLTVTTSAAAVPNPNAIANDFNTLVGDTNALVGQLPTDANAAIGQLPGNANSVTGNANSLAGQSVALAIVTQANACDEEQANNDTPNNSAIAFAISGVTQPGTYAITPQSAGQLTPSTTLDRTLKSIKSLKVGSSYAVTGAYLATDAQCQGKINVIQSGTLTLTKFDTTKAMVGSYDITLTSGDKLSGTFDAANCPPNQSTTPATCGG